VQSIGASLVEGRRRLMEDEIGEYYPDFLDHLEYVGPQISQKTKVVGESGDRSCYVQRVGRCISVLSGKIDTIFYAMDRVLWLIGSHDPPDTCPESSVIVDQIRHANASLNRVD
jgi:hypothetical protein